MTSPETDRLAIADRWPEGARLRPRVAGGTTLRVVGYERVGALWRVRVRNARGGVALALPRTLARFYEREA